MGDVLVYDYTEKNRTFTDANGRFEFMAGYFEASGGEYDQNPANDAVSLGASVPGYIGVKHKTFSAPELDSDEGCVLVLRKGPASQVSCKVEASYERRDRVRFDLSIRGTNRAGFDEDQYLSVMADASGCATFEVPYGVNWTASAHDTGCVFEPVLERGEDPFSRKQYLFRPQQVPTCAMRGVVRCMRTGVPVTGVYVSFQSATQWTFSNSNGEFVLHIPIEHMQQASVATLTIRRSYYAGIRLSAKDLETREDEFGKLDVTTSTGTDMNIAIGMRPMVSVTGTLEGNTTAFDGKGCLDLRCRFGNADSSWGPYRIEGVQVDSSGNFNCPFFPWGRTTVAYRTVEHGKENARFVIDSSAWSATGPWRIRGVER